MRTSPTLPPLAALRAFEAVGRLSSFRRAGEELSITQSAVSHHIRQLEEALGVRLFVRKARSIVLTPEGQKYLDATIRAFGIIADATSELRGQVDQAHVRISLLPSFAANWLVARLSGFHTTHPKIHLELDPTLRLIDITANEADVAIRYGDGNWEGVDAQLLMTERLTPVVSPRFLREHPALAEPQDVRRHKLLLSRNPVDWNVWANSVGLDISQSRTLQLTDYNVTIQAAIDGQGIAIGRMLLIRDHLSSGRLVQPFDRVVTSSSVGHWLLVPRHRISQPALVFVDWLKEQVAAELQRGSFSASTL